MSNHVLVVDFILVRVAQENCEDFEPLWLVALFVFELIKLGCVQLYLVQPLYALLTVKSLYFFRQKVFDIQWVLSLKIRLHWHYLLVGNLKAYIIRFQLQRLDNYNFCHFLSLNNWRAYPTG